MRKEEEEETIKVKGSKMQLILSFYWIKNAVSDI
jgi:hypothetical protein